MRRLFAPGLGGLEALGYPLVYVLKPDMALAETSRQRAEQVPERKASAVGQAPSQHRTGPDFWAVVGRYRLWRGCEAPVARTTVRL